MRTYLSFFSEEIKKNPRLICMAPSRISKNLEKMRDFTEFSLWPNLKNLSGGLNLSPGLNMVDST